MDRVGCEGVNGKWESHCEDSLRLNDERNRREEEKMEGVFMQIRVSNSRSNNLIDRALTISLNPSELYRETSKVAGRQHRQLLLSRWKHRAWLGTKREYAGRLR
jgi:hypothetical protein